MLYLRDCLDIVFSGLLLQYFPLVSAGQCSTANRRKRWPCVAHLSKCEGEGFQEQFASLAGSYRVRTERARMVVSREGREGPIITSRKSESDMTYRGRHIAD